MSDSPVPLSLVIHGASGRNGRRLLHKIASDPSLSLAGAIVSPRSEFLGRPAGELVAQAEMDLELSDAWPERFDAAIDFSSAAGAVAAAVACRRVGRPLVVASTGLTPEDETLLAAASEEIPICYAANFSPAVNLTMYLAMQASRVLAQFGERVDVEIIERHHRGKADSPSGTALKFGQLIARELDLPRAVHGRHGLIGPRPADEIGYHAVRVGDDAGQHTIVFGLDGELVELRCAASNRDPYATGAIAAARFLLDRPPGMYSMFDVLGLSTSRP